MKLGIPVKIENITRAKLQLLRPFLKELTTLEITIVAAMLDKKMLLLDRDNKSQLMIALDLGVHNFNNNIKRLADKGVLYLPENSKVWKLNPRVEQLTADNSITVEFQPYE